MMRRQLGYVEAALGERKSDSVVTGGELVNVVTGETYRADIAIYRGRIVSIGDVSRNTGDRTTRVDARGARIVPGLIDSHIHCEVTKLTMRRFAELILPRGTTAIATAFDQIAGIAGLPGVRSFLEEAEASGLGIIYGIPSKLPYTTPSSTLHHEFGPKEARVAARWSESAGVWETGPETILGSPDGRTPPDRSVLETIGLARERGLMVFGSAPLLRGARLSGYLSLGVRSDHESYTRDEALEKLRSGSYLIIRESSVVRFLSENIRLVTEGGVATRRIAFCTDDVTASDVLSHGHLDQMVRKAIELGVDPLAAVQMATINAAELYRVDDRFGVLSPGAVASMVLLDDLRRFRIRSVIAGGRIVEDSARVRPGTRRTPRSLLKTMHVEPPGAGRLVVRSGRGSRRVKVIAMAVERDAPFVRKRHEATLEVSAGVVLPDQAQDVVYVAAVERHKGTGNLAVAFIKGYGVRGGALASSVSPDDNNILCIGSSSAEMALAIREVIRLGGGQVVTAGGEIVASLPLPVGGIVADMAAERMAEKERQLDEWARKLGSKLTSPFMSMIFLSITAIPEYAITDRGLVDTNTLRVVDPVIGAA